MRVIINFTKNTELVPANNQDIINSYIHKCLGNNNKYHDSQSNYNVSKLLGGERDNTNHTLNFEKGGKIVVSSIEYEFLDTLLSGIITNPNLSWGMSYVNVDFVNETFYNEVNHFKTLSPILLKENLGNSGTNYVTINDYNFDEVLTARMLKKLKIISEKLELKLKLDNFKITTAKTLKGKGKVIRVKLNNDSNFASDCIISVTCDKKTAELLSNIGVGQSTGCGFGCVCKVENIKAYKPN